MKRWWLMLSIATVLSAGVVLALRSPLGAIAQERLATVAFTPQERTTLVSLESALTRLVETVQPTVVHIRVKKRLPQARIEGDDEMRQFFRRFGLPDDDLPRLFEFPLPRVVQGEGSGVIIRSDGYILTNDHVVSGADEVEVTFTDGSKASGTVLRAPNMDIALVKVDRKNLPTAMLGDSSAVKPGQIVFAFGSPFGLEKTVTMGIVSAVGRREVIRGADMPRYYPDMIQTDAPINGGNSGGPLVNARGEVIGINTAIVSGLTGGNVGIGFAIPINRAKTVVRQLIEKGSYVRGYLGVGLDDLTPEMKAELKVERGALVMQVERNSPADKAGIQAGDVIVEMDGKPVEDQVALRDMIAEKGPNAEARFKIVRGGRTLTVSATLGTHPEDVKAPPVRGKAEVGAQTALEKLGIRVGRVPDDVSKAIHHPQGAFVSEIDRDSPAAEGGLRVGDLIIAVNDKPVNSPSEFEQAVQGIKSGQMVRLRVLRQQDDRVFESLVMFRMP
ncbi:MAG: trypsin-like peptidase domain-containing protein [Fimbriimonadales bacterium]|nr:trypsin-like peptidase domain-containing protein [Fimbriimonadales bacterium]